MTDGGPFPTDTPPDAMSLPGESTGEGSSWPTVRRLGPDGRYHLEETIASGGAATVWRAYDDQLDRSVAIKILHPHLVGDEDTVRRFERESRNAARLHHPNAIQIYDSGRVGDVVYLVMEFVDGPTLKQVLRTHGALTEWPVVAAIGEQIAAALAEAHAQHLIHRDIKPANILFTTEGIVKVVDFGIAKALTGATTDLTAEGMTVGTATYIAPEQYTGAEIDARADVYALGMVMYECLTGRPAYSGDTPTATAAARLTREILPPRQVRADVDRRLEDVIVRCARRDPNERFNDVSAVAHALRQLNSDVEPHELTRDLVSSAPPDQPSLPEFPEVDPDAETDPGMAAGDGGPNRVRMVLAFIAGIALTVAAVMAWSSSGGGPLVGDPGTTDSLEILSAGDYDPIGDQRENSDDVPKAFDRDVTTFWETEGYGGDAPQNGKPGVGLWFELGDQTVDSLEIAFTAPGVEFKVYGADELPGPSGFESLVDWGTRIAEFEADSASTTTYTFDEPQTHQYWLVLLTGLPIDPQDNRQRDRGTRLHGHGHHPHPGRAACRPRTRRDQVRRGRRRGRGRRLRGHPATTGGPRSGLRRARGPLRAPGLRHLPARTHLSRRRGGRRPGHLRPPRTQG